MSKQDEKSCMNSRKTGYWRSQTHLFPFLQSEGFLAIKKLMMRRCVLPEGEKAECLSQYPDAPQKLQENGVGVQLLPGGDFAGTGGSV